MGGVRIYYFIINPVSRSGKGLEIWKQAKHTLETKKLTYKAFFTKYSGHGTKLARKIAPRCAGHTLIIIGGDGTVNEVLNGLPMDHSIRLGYLPVGSGNDFARGLELLMPLTEALENIMVSGKVRQIDTGTVTNNGCTSRFAISGGFGYDAEICYEVSHTPVKKWLNRLHLGKLTYAFAAIKLLFTFQPCDMEVIPDDGHRYYFSKVYFIAGMNLQYEGGGFRFCPEASYCDGKLDFLIVHDLSKLKILLLFPTAYFAKHTHIRGITILRSRSLQIHSRFPHKIHRDGEYAGTCNTLSFDTQKQSLDIIS